MHNNMHARAIRNSAKRLGEALYTKSPFRTKFVIKTNHKVTIICDLRLHNKEYLHVLFTLLIKAGDREFEVRFL